MIKLNKRGSVLILIYVVVIMLLVMASTLFSSSISEKTITDNTVRTARAFWLAESGIQRGLWEMRHNNASSTSGWILGDTFSDSMGSYNVTYDPGSLTLNATGHYAGVYATTIAKTVIVTVNNPGIPYFKFAAFGKKYIYLHNNAFVDSYNSSAGSYATSMCNGINCSGDIGTNGDAVVGKKVDGAVTVDNNADIWGDVSSGGGNTTIDNNGTVHGDLLYNQTTELPSIQVPAAVLSASYTTGDNISDSSITLPNNEIVTLTAGASGIIKLKNMTLNNSAMLTINNDATVYLTGFINVQNNAQLRIASSAKVIFYVDGRFDFINNGAINNLGQIPGNFTFFCNYTGNVTVANNVDFYGAIYAPNVNITLNNNGATYGAVVGNTMNVSENALIHYDTELARIINTTENNVNVTSWREL